MPTIRCKYHFTNYWLSPDIKRGTRPLCGQTVAIVRDNQCHREHFAGFWSIEDMTSGSGCIITNIDAFTADCPLIGPYTEFNRFDLFLGTKTPNGVYLILVDDRPYRIGHGEYGNSPVASGQKKSNVTSIGPD